MNIIRTSLTGTFIVYGPVIFCRAVNKYFPKPTDLRVQAGITPRWRSQIRENFERKFLLNIKFKRAFTVIIPNNLPIFLYMIHQLEQLPSPNGRALLPLTHPLLLAVGIIGMVFNCYCYDRIRSLAVETLKDIGVSLRYRWIFGPSDYNPIIEM